MNGTPADPHLLAYTVWVNLIINSIDGTAAEIDQTLTKNSGDKAYGAPPI